MMSGRLLAAVAVVGAVVLAIGDQVSGGERLGVVGKQGELSPEETTTSSPPPTTARTFAAPVPTTTVAPPPPAITPVVSNGPRTRPLVALTFDSDMNEAMLRSLNSHRVASYDATPVVDVLQEMKVPATFFLTGMWVERYPETAARIAADPMFEAANHSYSHRSFAQPCYGLPAVPPGEMAADVQRAFDAIRVKVPQVKPYFRFPGGCYNEAALRALAPLGITGIQWDVVGGDPFNQSPDSIVQASLAKAQPGSIIVLHSTFGTAPMTAKALPRIIAGLKAKGLTPVTLSELLNHPAAAKPNPPHAEF
ncbi:polysaccharide deacetylase [Pseudonocardiaceae bacterium YIM PH 21723]|nr:polysaccharide deacetylase [Pseudonocardiaceae bacterium YIM PH 21723]